MLELKRQGFFSQKYIAQENGIVVAEIIPPRWRKQGELLLQGYSLRLMTPHIFKNVYALCDGDVPLVEVTQPSIWNSRLVFSFNETEYEIVNKAWYSSTLQVRLEGTAIGSVQIRGVFTEVVYAELPDSLPIAVRVFICWVAMVRHDRDAATAAVTGAG